MSATKNTLPATKKLNLTVVAVGINDFVSKISGLNITDDDQKKIDAAIQGYFADVENELKKGGKAEISVEDFLGALKKTGLKIQIAGASNQHLETIVTTLAPSKNDFDWKAFGMNCLKYGGTAVVGVGVGYYGSQYIMNRRAAAVAAEAHKAVVTPMRRVA